MCEKNTKLNSEKSVCSEKPGHGWDSFQRRSDNSFKKLPESHSTRDWWITAAILLATAVGVIWFVTKDAPEVREFIKLFSIITGGMLIWIFGFQLLAWLLRELGLKLGFSPKVLDRKYYFCGWYGRYGQWW